MTSDDWQALIEEFLTDESDAETFKETFLEGLKDAREDNSVIPDAIEELAFEVEQFDPDEGDEEELRTAVQKTLRALKRAA